VNTQSSLVGADRFSFTLAPLELSVLRQAHGVRSRLLPLRLGNTSVGPVRLAALTDAVDTALDRRGLSADGTLVAPVRTAFELLAEHRVAVSVTGSPGDLAALAVSDGVQAQVITQVTEEELRFVMVRADELAAAVVAVLPPAPGTPPAVPVTGPRLGGGLLVASGRGRNGRWTDTLGWVDTPAGRHLIATASDRSGNRSARYTPAGPTELTAAVAALLEA
jgi:hypothetical protein